MRPVLFIVGLVALYAQSITSHPTLLPLPFLTNDVDDAGLLSADLGLDPPNQFFTPVVGTADDPQPGALFPALDTDTSSSPSSSDNAEEALLSSQQVALDDEVGSLSASSPPLLLDNSQESRDPAGCDTGLKGKRETTGGAAGTSTYCPALYPSTNLIPPSAPAPAASAQKKNPEGQQQDEEKEEEEEEQHQGQEPQTNANAKPREPGSRGDLRLNPSDEPAHNPFGEKNKEPQCPPHYRYTVCGSIKFEHSTGASPLTVYDADLVINFGFGYGTVIRPGKLEKKYPTPPPPPPPPFFFFFFLN